MLAGRACPLANQSMLCGLSVDRCSYAKCLILRQPAIKGRKHLLSCSSHVVCLGEDHAQVFKIIFVDRRRSSTVQLELPGLGWVTSYKKGLIASLVVYLIGLLLVFASQGWSKLHGLIVTQWLCCPMNRSRPFIRTVDPMTDCIMFSAFNL